MLRSVCRVAEPPYYSAMSDALREFLDKVNYPATKEEILDHAREEGVEDKTLAVLGQLPDRSYDTPAEILKAVGDLEPVPGP
ncbi:MAG: hypothetical protein UY99_C0023G0011 [Parcubacteria group bacterium GW2011_GWA1_59_11]|nr:MAG: hypothetical protein UY99_C0023G0011 [Parcubacteria group bacterium GW2011_GWA1_59_11]